jgi:hypothetical protein
MTQLQLDMTFANDSKADHLFAVAQSVAARLKAQIETSRADLSAMMESQFAGSDASGAWSMRDAYDAVELAQVLLQQDLTAQIFAHDSPRSSLTAIEAMSRLLPTQTYRSENQVALQQFSTPALLAFVAAHFAQMGPVDTVLEPSAGTGLLAVHAQRVGAKLLLNELDDRRAALLARAFLAVAVTRHDGATIHDALHQPVSVVLMNPPYSKSAGIGDDAYAGARHLRAALLALAPGGRGVAIMPSWFSPDGSGAAGYSAIMKIARPCFDLLCDGSFYAKHGTSISVRILVFDKGRDAPTLRLSTKSLGEALYLTEQIPPRLHCAWAMTSSPARVVRTPTIGKSPASAGLLQQSVSARPIAPRPPQLDLHGGDARELAYTPRTDIRPSETPVGIYVPYRVARIDFADATDHPTPLVESLAMASIVPPPASYIPKLPGIAARALSAAQLETLCYAGQSFLRDLPGQFVTDDFGLALTEHADGASYRAGYFLGDGTGAGKGRQVAGIVMDQWVRGNRRHVWISKSAALLEDARRDWGAIGGIGLDIQPLTDWALGDPVNTASGILFATYATLRSSRPEKGSRIDQILAWVSGASDAADADATAIAGSASFDGLIIFDEAHAMANAAGSESARGVMRGSEQGICGVRLQHLLPRARILYVSATGATDIANLAYATRLGLWGPSTAFETREIFMQQMREGGMAAMELVARDLKALGLYTSRALSFDGVEYDILDHKLTEPQISIYDTYCDAWEIIHQNLDAALEATNVVDPMSGKTLNGQAKGAALSRFESTKQRFFGQMLTAMKLPSLIPAIEADLDNGDAAVIQLVSTAEAMLGRRLAELSPDERAALEIELSPREYVIDYLTNAFPTRAMEIYADDEGFLRSRPALDAHGNPAISSEAVAARDRLVEQLCALPAVSAALDELIRHFGTDSVAEVTGRTRRLVTDRHGNQKLESRSARTNLAETSAFMDGSKRIIVFSDAGGTGRSYHADKNARNQRRRIHYLLEPGWRADAAIQGLGRSHRTHQASAPLFRPVTTDVKGEKRFISTIARRLDSLGALTRGQRQTGGQNLFDAADNLESVHAKEALNRWYHLLHSGKLTSIDFSAFERRSGLKLLNEDGELREDLPPIQRWLNRLLAFPIHLQNAVFDEYLALVEARIDALREAGKLDVGVETILAEKIVEIERHLLQTDRHSQAETHLLRLELHFRPAVLGFERMLATTGQRARVRWLRNDRSGMVAAEIPGVSMMADDGEVLPIVQLIRPTKTERIKRAALDESHWHEIDLAGFEPLWRAETETASQRIEIETVNVATGLLLPIWNKLPRDQVRVWRIADRDGASYLGRLVPDADLGELAERLGVNITIDVAPAALVQAANNPGRRVNIPGTELILVSSLVNGSRRIELKGYAPERLDWYKSLGLFTEIIAYKTRLFIPVDRAELIVATLCDQKSRLAAAA